MRAVLASAALLLLLTGLHTPAVAGAGALAVKPAYDGAHTLVQKAGKLRRSHRRGWRHKQHSNGWPVVYGYRFQPYSGWHYGARYYPWYRPYRHW